MVCRPTPCHWSLHSGWHGEAAAGPEPATPASRTQCADLPALQPVAYPWQESSLHHTGLGGEGGIRTHAAPCRSALAGQRLRPLGHLSVDVVCALGATRTRTARP